MTSLENDPLKSLLARLHGKAGNELGRTLFGMAGLMIPRAFGRKRSSADHARAARNLYIALEPEAGRFAYSTARAIGARTIIEYGTSFGISTLYLAAAVRDTIAEHGGSGRVITTELNHEKCGIAGQHFAEAGLADLIELREGDALETLCDLPESVDMLLCDGWVEHDLTIKRMVEPHLRKGGVVLCDNINLFRWTLKPYVAEMQHGGQYSSQTIPLGTGMEYSVRV